VLWMWAGLARHLALKKMMQAQLLVLIWLLIRHGALSSGISISFDSMQIKVMARSVIFLFKVFQHTIKVR
jgi:hypothetical protein